MSNENVITADAAAGEGNLPVRKRKAEELLSESSPVTAPGEAKLTKTQDGDVAASTASAAASATSDADEGEEEAGSNGAKPLKRPPMSKAREVRLEQNRKAARESRRRKKTMIDELQRSVIFFSRANSTLKQQNDELTRLLVQAQTQVSAIESGQQQQQATASNAATLQAPEAQQQQQGDQQQQQAQAVAQQAVYEAQGFSSNAARAAAQTMNAGGSTDTASATAPGATPSATTTTTTTPTMPTMQTGATMQAMANFQQAAAAAMANAMGMNPQLVPAANSTQQQQAYTDAMNAMVMQQAAAAAAGGQAFPFLPQQMPANMFQGMQFPMAMAQPTQAAPVDANQQQQQQPPQQQQVQPQEQSTIMETQG